MHLMQGELPFDSNDSVMSGNDLAKYPSSVYSDAYKGLTTTPFETIRKRMSSVTDDGGVMKEVIRAGTGEMVPLNAVVYVHYSVFLELEEIPIDSSYLQSKRPKRFASGILPLPFKIAVESMRVNEKSIFLVKPEYAFGKIGCPPRIPPNATLLYEIELFEHVDCGKAYEASEVTSNTSFIEVFKVAKACHLLGNDYYKHNSSSRASTSYKKGVKLLLGVASLNNEEKADQQDLLLKLLSNLCICHTYGDTSNPKKVCTYAEQSMQISPEKTEKNKKLLYHWGKALVSLNQIDVARKKLLMAQAIDPSCSLVNAALKELDPVAKTQLELEKNWCMNMFGTQKERVKSDKLAADPLDSSELFKGVSPSFISLLRRHLSSLVATSSGRIKMPHGLTREEKNVCKIIAQEFGVTYQENSTSFVKYAS